MKVGDTMGRPSYYDRLDKITQCSNTIKQFIVMHKSHKKGPVEKTDDLEDIIMQNIDEITALIMD